jgi:hypothetical protein
MTQPHYNFRTGAYAHRRDDGRLEVIGPLPHPDDEDAPAGLWFTAVVDDTATDPHVVSVAVSEDEPGLPPSEPAKILLREGRVDRGEEPVPITADVLRSLPMRVVRDVAQTYAPGVRKPDELDRRRLPDPTKLPRHDDKYFAAWAGWYIATTASGSDRPVADVAERFGVGRDQLRDVLNTARSRGLLTRGVRGGASGELTDKARAALEREKG